MEMKIWKKLLIILISFGLWLLLVPWIMGWAEIMACWRRFSHRRYPSWYATANSCKGSTNLSRC